MMSEAEALQRQCPLLLPQNREKTIYDGFITAQDRDFRLRIILPSDAQLKNARLQFSVHLKNVLRGYHQIVKQRLQHSCDLSNFILELKTILEVALKNRQEQYAPPPPQYYSCLVKDIENFGWDKLVFVDSEFSIIQLKVNDTAGREHQITLQLKANYPLEPPDCVVDFPIPFAITWTPESSLINIQKQFLAALDSMKEFWDVMDEIDEETWVLEPEKPTRNATARRIAIGNNVSINIDVDPRHPKMFPECYFLGADHVVTPLRSKLNSNIHLWDPENNLLQNLKNVLEIDFPVRTNTAKSDFSMDCGICYAYRLDTAIPDQVCNDPRCGQLFHQVCLYEWLRGLPSSRQSFNVIFGECPYCNKPIALKMTSKKT